MKNETLVQGSQNEKSQTEVWLEVSTTKQGELRYGRVPKDSGANNSYKFGGRLKLLLYPFVQ